MPRVSRGFFVSVSTDSQTPPVTKSRPFRHWLPHFGATSGVTGSDGSEVPVRQAFGLASRVPKSLVLSPSGVVPGIRDSICNNSQAAIRLHPAVSPQDQWKFAKPIPSASPSRSSDLQIRTRTCTQRSGTRFGLARQGHHGAHREHEGRLGEDGARGFLAKTQSR